MQHMSLKKMWLHIWKYHNSEKNCITKLLKAWSCPTEQHPGLSSTNLITTPLPQNQHPGLFVADTEQQSSRSGWKASAVIQELSLLKQHWKTQLEYFYHDPEPLFMILHVADGSASCPAPASCSKSRSQIQRQHHPISLARHILPSSW